MILDMEIIENGFQKYFISFLHVWNLVCSAVYLLPFIFFVEKSRDCKEAPRIIYLSIEIIQ